MGGESSMVDGVVLEFENADIAVGGSACEETSGLMGGPSNDVDGSFVEGEIVNSLPGVVLGALLFPDEDFAVVAC